ncbi:MAG: TetR family transcriptional regulator [Myxococcota bacterium]|nr:TetR family transcriptional regulator [Myxococcota bacterium]
MARKANRSAQATKKNILLNAQFLFSERGLDGVSVRDIASRSNVNVALISHYFGGKQGLYDRCIESLYSDISTVQPLLIQTLQNGAKTPMLMSTIVKEAYRFACQHRGSLRLLQRDILQKGYFDHDKRNHYLLPLLAELEKLFPDVPAPQLRLGLQSLIFLIVRYALSTTQELSLLVPEKTHEELMTHLTQMAHTVFFPFHPSESP